MELKAHELVECINPEVRKGRLYRLTDKGEEVTKNINWSNLIIFQHFFYSQLIIITLILYKTKPYIKERLNQKYKRYWYKEAIDVL